MPPEVTIVPTGAANLSSVRAAFARLGAPSRLGADPRSVREAPYLVLPGVGAFGEVAPRLAASGTAAALRERVERGAPTLAVCLGLQLLSEGSDEAPGIPGLGVLPCRVRSLPPGLPVPHLGWNRVQPESRGPVPPGWAYFANSYALDTVPAGWNGARFLHGGSFVAAVWRERVLACQFHPELSGAWGEKVLRAWLEGSSYGRKAPPVSGCGLAPRVIPCLDLDGGRIVKGVRFQGLADAGDPAERAAAYAAQGADELVLLDVSATPQDRAHRSDVVAAVREAVNVPLTVGGGVRSVEDARALLEAGADRVAVNTAAVARPALIEDLASAFGRQCVVVALDAARNGSGWEVVVRSGTRRTGLDAADWARTARDMGAGELLLTSWDRDGTRSGYDLELIRAVRSAVDIPIIASGGASGARHLAEALEAGASAVLAASILHRNSVRVQDLKADLIRFGLEVRP